jgi:hypothetical protein
MGDDDAITRYPGTLCRKPDGAPRTIATIVAD